MNKDLRNNEQRSKKLCAGLTILTSLVLVGSYVAYTEETNIASTQETPAATSTPKTAQILQIFLDM